LTENIISYTNILSKSISPLRAPSMKLYNYSYSSDDEEISEDEEF